MIITSDAVPKNACGWETGNNYITSHGLIIDFSFTVHHAAHSASDLLEATSKSQADGAASTSNSCSSVFSTNQLDEERRDKLYPIPPRRTKKMKVRSRSSSAVTSLEPVGRVSTDKNVNAVFKKPLTGQRSNPELTRKVKPPRPPPPNRQIPPRTYLHPDSKTSQAESTKHRSVVVDTRAQRQGRHRRASQPERPPLPYETFVPQKQPSHTNSSRQDSDHINGSVATVKDRQQEEDPVKVLVTPPPAEYEAAVPRNTAASPRKSSVPDNIPTNELSKSIHPFPGPVRGRKIAAGGDDHNKVDNLANRRNDHRESVAVPYEVPSIKTKQGEMVTDEAKVKDSTTVLTKKQMQAEGNDDQGAGVIPQYLFT